MNWFFDSIGLIGVAIFTIAYFLLQHQKISTKKKSFHIANMIGSALVIISLFHDWNLPQFLMEAIWLVVSFYGLIRNYRGIRRKNII